MIKFDEFRAEMRELLREIDATKDIREKRKLQMEYAEMEKEYKEARKYYREAKKKRRDHDRADGKSL